MFLGKIAESVHIFGCSIPDNFTSWGNDPLRTGDLPQPFQVENEQEAFRRYAIQCKPFEEFLGTGFPQGQNEEEAFYPWMLDQEEAFERLWERMTDEASHLLFGNRGFLLKFNLVLAEFRRQRGDSPSLRCAVPQWVKKAVYFARTANAPSARKTSQASLP